MPDAYLKCQYGPGTFSGEYAILFAATRSPKPYSWCFINREDLVESMTQNTGLVKAVLLAHAQDEMLLEINDVGDHRPSKFYVPRSSVLLHYKRSKQNTKEKSDLNTH